MTHSISRRGLVRGGAAALAGAAVAGTVPAPVQARTTTLAQAVTRAADAHGVPRALLLALGYVNTRLETPPPEAVAYRPGDPEALGAYGVMALVRNPFQDTLGLASELAGLAPEAVMVAAAPNLMAGAALLAHSQGRRRPAEPRAWLGALAGDGGAGPLVRAVAGIGGGELVAEQVASVLDRGFTHRTRAGERLRLAGRAAR